MEGNLYKSAMQMAYGHYDWPLAHQLAGHKVFFLHKSGESKARKAGGGAAGGVPKLLALSPAVPLWRVRTFEELSAVMHALATVGGGGD